MQIKREYCLCPTVWEFYLELFKLSLKLIITINFTGVLHYFELKPEDFI